MTVPPSRPDADTTRTWLAQVRPESWPAPVSGSWDLVVIGGGTAGLVAAMGAAGLGARVALVERHRLGGDCLNTGCVPSKALLASAAVVRQARQALQFGIRVGAVEPEFPAIMARMRALRADMARHDGAARLAAAGVQVVFGDGRFTGPRTLQIGPATLQFRRALIATGTRPVVPPVPGLAALEPLTTDTLFDLQACPARLLVIGAGPAGCEMAQAFAAFGSAVTLVEVAPQVLPREDPEASAVLAEALVAEGVTLALGARLTSATRGFADRPHEVRWHTDGKETVWTGDAVLVAAGRVPNLEPLDLPAAGVKVDGARLRVDDRLRTSNRRIFAAGDVASPWRFTHAADATARLVVQNALFFGRRSVARLVVPRCTWTDPEIAHVGVGHDQAARAGLETVTVSLADVDRAVLDGATPAGRTAGFVRLHHRRGRLTGATIVGPHAGDLIAQLSRHLQADGTLGALSATLAPYPAYADALRRAGDAWQRSRLTPGVRRMFARYLTLWRWF